MAGPSVVVDAALAYADAGLSIIPIATDGSKSPATLLLPVEWFETEGRWKATWKPYQQRLATEAEIFRWYGDLSSASAMAVVCGGISGGLEMIDFDRLQLFPSWADKVRESSAGLLQQLVYSQTPRPGLHAWFRSPAFGGSGKLAQEWQFDPESGKRIRKTLIELKGEGGYAIVPPSPPGTHPSGQPYLYFTERTLLDVPTITAEQRAVLLAAAMSFDTISDSASHKSRHDSSDHRRPSGNRPGDHYNAVATWDQILRPYGWTLVGNGSTGVSYWRRPGKTTGVSATTNFGDSDLLYVFTTNGDPFEQFAAYSKFAAYALLAHSGDFFTAARELRARGYGSGARLGQPRRA